MFDIKLELIRGWFTQLNGFKLLARTNCMANREKIFVRLSMHFSSEGFSSEGFGIRLTGVRTCTQYRSSLFLFDKSYLQKIVLLFVRMIA